MSNYVSTLCQRKKAGSQVKKAILMYMADKASDDGSGIWVSKANMAADLEMGVRTVQENIKHMIAMGVIIKAGERECKSGYTVDYTLNLDVIRTLENAREAAPLRQPHPYPCENRTPPPATAAPKPSIEPSIEPISSSDDEGLDYYFDQLWEDYPRKVGKAQAKKAFKTASKKINFYDLLPKYMAYVLTLKGKEEQFIPHLATWLNGERWNDEGK